VERRSLVMLVLSEMVWSACNWDCRYTGVKGGEPQLDQSRPSSFSVFISGSGLTVSQPSSPENIGFRGVARISPVLFAGLPIELLELDSGGVAG
jgi:hypothetical protein